MAPSATPAPAPTGAKRTPPLTPPRPIFMHAPTDHTEDSAPPTPGENPFSSGSVLSSAAHSPAHTPPRSPVTSTALPRVHTSSSLTSPPGLSLYPGASITARSSGILSPGASAVDLGVHSAHVRHASLAPSLVRADARSHASSGLSTGDVAEEPRPGAMRRQASALRETFASPPPRPLTFYGGAQARPGSQGHGLVSRATKRPKSTMLTGEIEKPWTTKKDTVGKVAYFLTYGIAFLGIVASAVRCYFGYIGVPRFKNDLCPVLEDNFDTFDENVWQREVRLDGFGNGEFEITTDSSNNSFVQDGKLYIMPTLTSDVIGQSAIFNGHTFNVSGCTGLNYTACGAVSNRTTNTVIPPAMSARLTTRASHAIRFGRVEIRAKLPRGDWLWPALWMLPKDNIYGEWPLSGEIDIMESRGNGPTYPKQGRNYVRGSLNWGPITWLNAVYKTYGWWTERRTSYDRDFHTYVLEWTADWMRIYVDTRLHHMLDLRFNKPFFARGDFPAVVTNGTDQIVLEDPWAANATVVNAAPFDQNFYLIMNVAVGGTNGWFPDNAGGKPWLDGSLTAMSDFAQRQDEWYATWPQGDEINDRAMVVDYVKMWKEC